MVLSGTEHRRRNAAPRGRRSSLLAARAAVFTTSTGTRYSDRNIRRDTLDPALQRAGVPWASFHTFRHTAASLLFAGGKNVRQVSDWLGHSDPAFTLSRYVHLMDDGLGDADFLDDAVGGNEVATDHPETAASAEQAGVALLVG